MFQEKCLSQTFHCLFIILFSLSRPSPTPPAGPTFYVDLATPDSTAKEAMEGTNIQVNQPFKYS